MGDFLLGGALRDERVAQGLTQERLSARAVVSRKAIVAIESGQGSIVTLGSLAAALGLIISGRALPNKGDHLGHRLQGLRNEQKLGRRVVARFGGVSVPAIAALERTGQGHVATLEAVGRVLHADLCLIRAGVQPPPVLLVRKRHLFDTSGYANNADLVAAAAGLYIRDGDTVADVTFAKGAFWRTTDTSRFELLRSDALPDTAGLRPDGLPRVGLLSTPAWTSSCSIRPMPMTLAQRSQRTDNTTIAPRALAWTTPPSCLNSTGRAWRRRSACCDPRGCRTGRERVAPRLGAPQFGPEGANGRETGTLCARAPISNLSKLWQRRKGAVRSAVGVGVRLRVRHVAQQFAFVGPRPAIGVRVAAGAVLGPWLLALWKWLV